MQKNTLKIIVSDSKKPSPEFEKKYPELFNIVQEKYHVPYLLFLCEILGIIDHDEKPIFTSSCYTESDMFGGRSQYWSILTKNISLNRAIDKEINDSWQSVTENENSLTINGMPDGTFLDWDGVFCFEQEYRIGNIDQDQIDQITAVSKKLFKAVKTEMTTFDPMDKVKSDLRRQHKFKDKTTLNDSSDPVEAYGNLILDSDEETAKGAIENLKAYFKNHEKIDQIKKYLLLAMQTANKYVKNEIIKAVGFSYNPELSDVITAGLKDPEDFVSEEACKLADVFYQESTVGLLIKNCRSIGCNLRWMAVSGLGKVLNSHKATDKEKKEIVKVLIKHLKDEDRYVRQSALYALGDLKNQKALPYLEKLLDKETDGSIIHTIKLTIGKIKKV